MIIKVSRDSLKIIRFGTCKRTSIKVGCGGWCVFIDLGKEYRSILGFLLPCFPVNLHSPLPPINISSKVLVISWNYSGCTKHLMKSCLRQNTREDHN